MFPRKAWRLYSGFEGAYIVGLKQRSEQAGLFIRVILGTVNADWKR